LYVSLYNEKKLINRPAFKVPIANLELSFNHAEFVKVGDALSVYGTSGKENVSLTISKIIFSASNQMAFTELNDTKVDKNQTLMGTFIVPLTFYDSSSLNISAFDSFGYILATSCLTIF
jgi:hypothetical protein